MADNNKTSGYGTKYQSLVVIGIVLAAALLRLYGIHWGIPNSLHAYSYHPDEFLTTAASLFVLQAFDPKFYNYPSLYISISALAILVGVGYGVKSVYLISRVVTAAMGTAAVAVAYWAGSVLYGSGVGLVAALILAVAPMHVQHSHFATVDVPCTLFVAAALGFAGLVFKRGSWRDYLLCGVMTGLAAGTKYNAGIIVFSLIAAHIMRDGLIKSIKSARVWGALACTLLAFIISTPGIILHTGEFLNGFTYELRHAALGHGLVFAGTGNGFIYTFTHSLWYGLGPGLAILFALAVAWSLVKRDKSALILLAFVLPYYALISISEVRFARYALPMYPAVAILIAGFIVDLWRVLSASRVRSFKWIWVGIVIVVAAGTMTYTLALDRLFALPDPRDEAQIWIQENVAKGSGVGVIEVPWFYSPPLSKNLGSGVLSQRIEQSQQTPYDLTIFTNFIKPGGWYTPDSRLEWIITSDYETEDALRLKNNKSLSEDNAGQVKRAMTDLDLIRQHYSEAETFSNKVSLFGIDLLDTCSLPHDMRYPSPTITIYRLQK